MELQIRRKTLTTLESFLRFRVRSPLEYILGTQQTGHAPHKSVRIEIYRDRVTNTYYRVSIWTFPDDVVPERTLLAELLKLYHEVDVEKLRQISPSLSGRSGTGYTN